MNALRILPPIAVLAAAWLTMSWLIGSRPEPKKRSHREVLPAVEVAVLQKTDYQVRIPTRGAVRARTRSSLVPQVSGEIVAVGDDFREGGFFEKGELLLEIDKLDYINAVTVAEGALAQAQAAYEQEQARAEQARANWERLGGDAPPSPLVLRQPQLAEAKAKADSAQAQLDRAKRDLERTSIRAPFAGHVRTKTADVGEYVTPGTPLAEIYAIDFAQVRLPLTNPQLTHLRIPEPFRDGGGEPDPSSFPDVVLSTNYGGDPVTWKGKIVRSEGAIDTRSRQLYVIAQIPDPYARRDGSKTPLKVGMFVEAEILGETLHDAFVVPRRAIRDGDAVMVLDAEDRLVRKQVEILWGGQDQVVISGELEDGTRVSLTPLSFAPEGTKVKPNDKSKPPAEAPPVRDARPPGR